MNNEVLAEIVTALGSVLAAVIGVAGVYAILKHRRKVKLLSQQVEAYYHHEGQLVSKQAKPSINLKTFTCLKKSRGYG